MTNWHGETAVGETHEWYTPPAFFDALGATFDLDPCMPPIPFGARGVGQPWPDDAPPVPWVPVRRWYTPADNGLVQPWDGLVWLNPPYGNQAVPFLSRLVEHGHGIALVFARTETAWWHASAPRASSVLFLRDRVHHIRADGHQGRGAMGSALLAYGDEASAVLLRSRLAGWLVAGSRSRAAA
jgi:hypothetical protein